MSSSIPARPHVEARAMPCPWLLLKQAGGEGVACRTGVHGTRHASTKARACHAGMVCMAHVMQAPRGGRVMQGCVHSTR
eukprot:354603-Chlamydomonas_euryale.AAC.4